MNLEAKKIRDVSWKIITKLFQHCKQAFYKIVINLQILEI